MCRCGHAASANGSGRKRRAATACGSKVGSEELPADYVAPEGATYKGGGAATRKGNSRSLTPVPAARDRVRDENMKARLLPSA